jgi:predicted enzyme related to lactoylglutathione lyase
MLANAFASATVPAEDLDRGIKFYTEVLGLEKIGSVMPGQAVNFAAGQGTRILMYKRARTKAEHTAITFTVDDVEATVKGLIAKGVTFEQYDMGPLKTNELGIADMGNHKIAWLTDPEGNILGIVSVTR